MRSKALLYLLIIAGLVIFQACRKDDNTTPNGNGTIESMNDLKVSSQFNYETTQDVAVRVNAKDNKGNPMKKVKVSLYTDYPENGGRLVLSGATDENGLYEADYRFPAYLDTLIVTTPYIGLPNATEAIIENGTISHTIGGELPSLKSQMGPEIPFKSTMVDFYTMGAWDFFGVPDYLEPENDALSQDFLDDINASLPEGEPLPESHPGYFGEDFDFNLTLVEPCDVWVTFVHEGAGYKNVLGYFTYEAGNPPQSVDDIDSLIVIYPNVSFQGSGGGLVAGNKVYLGQFPGGVKIGTFLIADGWDQSTQQITEGKNIFYSIPDLNPEGDPELRQHNIILNDPTRDIFLLGFEDLRRDQWTDEDFNDAVFYFTANPIESVDDGDLPLMDYGNDNDFDDDGIPDNMDDYPEDPEMAFNNYYPTDSTFGSLAFEDLWPAQGDYDFNDMVIDYHFNQITNAGNKVVQVKAKFVLRAWGASFKNGFGFEMNALPQDIESVTGIDLQEAIITTASNNVEEGQEKAVIIAFDNAENILPRPGQGSPGIGVNTTPASSYVIPEDTVEITINMANLNSIANVGIPPYNPFIFVNQVREHEIHLSNHPPTDLMNTNLFGQSADDSQPELDRYYKTENNLPWGIDIVESFAYPVEKVDITITHLKFAPWAQSEGIEFPDWFLDKNGYRDDGNIYTPN